MKIITWNINSINARFDLLKKVLKKHEPDIVMLQETKSQDINFPEMEVKSLGYNVVFRGQKSYNGVAMLIKENLKFENPLIDIPNFKDDNARFVQAEVKGVTFIGVYAPNGNPVDSPKFDYKLEWHEAINKHLKKLKAAHKKVIIGGDFNIVPTRIDVWDFDKYADNSLCHPESIKHYNRLINMGYVDAFRIFEQGKDNYTFWDYRRARFNSNKGFRIDFFLLSPDIAEKAKKCWIDTSFRAMEKSSDHTTLILEI